MLTGLIASVPTPFVNRSLRSDPRPLVPRISKRTPFPSLSCPLLLPFFIFLPFPTSPLPPPRSAFALLASSTFFNNCKPHPNRHLRLFPLPLYWASPRSVSLLCRPTVRSRTDAPQQVGGRCWRGASPLLFLSSESSDRGRKRHPKG
jgi:hypothetical protein